MRKLAEHRIRKAAGMARPGWTWVTAALLWAALVTLESWRVLRRFTRIHRPG